MGFSLKTTTKVLEANYARSTELETQYPSAIQLTVDLCQEIELNDTLRAEVDNICYGIMRQPFSKLKEGVDRRIELFDRAKNDLKFRKLAYQEAKEDPVAFVNNWCWTQDPRLNPGPTTIPFDLFPKQEEYLRWRQERRNKQENGIIRKPREMGLTWLNCASQLHPWLFEVGYKGGIGSRKVQLVDRIGDMDSIFEKIRFLIRNLPDWMLPEYQDNSCKIINLEKGSSITGEGGPQIGRGGRASVYDVDEAEFLEQDKKVDGALSETSRVIFWTSTVNIWNPSNIIRTKIRMSKIPVFSLNWRDDPRKDDEWYESRTKTLHPMIVASEIDCNDSASGEDTVIPIPWIKAAMERWQDRGFQYEHIGVDVSRGGNDNTVIAGRFQNWCDRLLVYPGAMTLDGDIVALRVIAASMKMNPVMLEGLKQDQLSRYAREMLSSVRIDVVGVGSSPFDCLRRLGVRRLSGLSGGERSLDNKGNYKLDRTGKLAFANRRAEWWWNLRELLDPISEMNIELPPDDELLTELSTPKYKIEPITDPDRILETDREEDRVMGMIRVESKDDIKKRIDSSSPDRADAVTYAFADVVPKPPQSEWLRYL